MTEPFNPQRRSLLQISAVAAVAASTAKITNGYAAQELSTMSKLPAFQSQSTLTPLAFDPSKMSGLSERLIRSHWENIYGGSVKALGVVKQQLLRTGSVVLHEYYFDNLGGYGQAGAAERKAIAESFGSFDSWETEFRRIGARLGGGSGWVVLGFNTHTRQIENYWLADHAHGPAATLPLLVMDMYEHSYQMDYGAAAVNYIDAFFKNIQWDAVAKRLESAQRANA